MRAIKAFSSNGGWGEVNGWGEEPVGWPDSESPTLSPISLPSLVNDDGSDEEVELKGFLESLVDQLLVEVGEEGNPIIVE